MFGEFYCLQIQNKKDMIPRAKRCKTWREEPAVSSSVDCQLGQALFYLLGHQLRALQHSSTPHPNVAIYMADGYVSYYYNNYTTEIYEVAFTRVLCSVFFLL